MSADGVQTDSTETRKEGVRVPQRLVVAFAAGTTAEERIRHNSTDLSTSKNDLPRYEDEKDDFRLDHAVDETREQLIAN